MTSDASTGASTPRQEGESGVEFSALKTLVEVSLGLSTATAAPGVSSPHLRERTPSPGGPRFDPNATIIVIGMRGVGKVSLHFTRLVCLRRIADGRTGQTTLGIIIATYLARPFVDADRLYERLFSVGIKDSVLESGWDLFRQRETAILEQLLRVQRRGQVIVLGGGVVESPANRELLRAYAASRGPVIHVSRPMEEVFAYLQRQGTKSTWAAFEEEGRVSASLVSHYLASTHSC